MIKILIVDDEEDIRETLKMRLEVEGYQVFEAKNGKIGVEMALALKPNIVLMDVMMPVMNGHQAIRLLLEKKFNGMILTFTTSVDITTAMKAGSYDFLNKPMTPYFEKRLKQLWRKFNGNNIIS